MNSQGCHLDCQIQDPVLLSDGDVFRGPAVCNLAVVP